MFDQHFDHNYPNQLKTIITIIMTINNNFIYLDISKILFDIAPSLKNLQFFIQNFNW